LSAPVEIQTADSGGGHRQAAAEGVYFPPVKEDAMNKLLGSLMLITALAVGGSALACSMQENASTDQSTVTAAAPAQSSTPAPGTTTTTPKTPEAKTGG
jgi:hypothetical protein